MAQGQTHTQHGGSSVPTPVNRASPPDVNTEAGQSLKRNLPEKQPLWLSHRPPEKNVQRLQGIPLTAHQVWGAGLSLPLPKMLRSLCHRVSFETSLCAEWGGMD